MNEQDKEPRDETVRGLTIPARFSTTPAPLDFSSAHPEPECPYHPGRYCTCADEERY